ncbi:MAG TPA: ABC transporter permease [Acidobacteriaceae bacterium]|jgi:putative ABC transport system permease protein|nr:ABC transporter permease [Acidobacteriaceae bacterium]
MGNGLRDVRYGLRILSRNKSFTAVAVLAVALGIGPNVAIFSIIWAVFFAPLPFPDASRLVLVWNHFKGDRTAARADDYAEYAAQSHSFSRLDFQCWHALHLTNPDGSQENTTGIPVSPGFITRTLGLRLSLGRDFLPGEGLPGNDHYVILEHRVWLTRFHADPHILGHAILIENQPYTVVGVVAQSPNTNIGEDGFDVPIVLTPGVHSPEVGAIFGRLKPGVTLAQAQADTSSIARRLRAADHRSDSGWSMTVEPLKNDWLDPDLARNLWLLLAAVGFVLLIACANVANLLLARGSARQQELAVRSAMGASRREIFAQLLTESITLSLFGGFLGIALGWTLMKTSLTMLPSLNKAVENFVRLNLPVFCFAVALTVLGGILFGCAPAWHATRVNLSEALKQGSRSVTGGRTRLQSLLVTAEFALALTLLGGAGMALHSFWNLGRIDLGITVNHVLGFDLRPRVRANQPAAMASPGDIIARQRRLLDRVHAVPGVADDMLATNLPLDGFNTFPFSIGGQPSDPNHPLTADLEAATPGFFRTLNVRLIRGRFFDESDTLSSPGAIVVNESFVRRYFRNLDPLGQTLLFAPPRVRPHTSQSKPQPPAEYLVIGVFHDILNSEHLTGSANPEMILSLWQSAWPYAGLTVRTTVDPVAVTGGVRAAIAEVEPDLYVNNVTTMRQLVDDQLTTDRFSTVLFAAFAAVALLLAAVGIYGVMSFAVDQRTHEIGIRMALGAQHSEVVSLIVRGGLRLALPGMAIGLAGVFILGRLLHSTLYHVGSVDYLSFTLVAALLLAVALLACWLPARRSARVDPMVALRNE